MVDGYESIGYYGLVRDQASSGTVSGMFSAHLEIVYQNGKDSLTQKLGLTTFDIDDGTWTELNASPTAGVALPHLQLGVALTATLSSPKLSLAVTPASLDLTRPGPGYVDPTAVVSPNVGSMGRFCAVGPGAVIDSGAVIGPHARIAGNSHVGSGAVIGNRAVIGSEAIIGADVFIGSFAVISPGAVIRSGAVIYEYAVVGGDCDVGVGAKVGANAVLEKGVVLGDGAGVGDGVPVGAFAELDPNVLIPSGMKIPSQEHHTTTLYLCVLEDGTEDYRSLPASNWASSDGSAVIYDENSLKGIPKAAVLPIGAIPAMAGETTELPVEVGAGGSDRITKLRTDIGSNIAPPENGGTGHPYTKGGYMCGYFAEALRHKLEELGYSTTFTCVATLNPKYKWWKFNKKWLRCHAMTDVHWPGGGIRWIEAQYRGDRGAVSAPLERLDPDGNKKVGVWNGVNVARVSDGDQCINVYGSRAEAEAAGENIPGN